MSYNKLNILIIALLIITSTLTIYYLFSQTKEITVKEQVEINQKLTKELQIKFSNLSADVQKIKEK